MNFKTRECSLCDVKLITPMVFEDNRGDFIKFYEQELFQLLNLPNEVHEIFISTSKKNVIRGMHFQTQKPQAKFVSCIQGEILDVIIDIRPNSKTYLKWEKFKLSGKNKDILYVPAGFAHGFQACEDDSKVCYINVGKYLKEFDAGLPYNDPTFNIDWNDYGFHPIISERDQNFETFKESKIL